MTFEHLLFTDHTRLSGTKQAYYSFPNGYSISVISGPGSYGGGDGLYEIGILLNERLVYGLKMRNPVGQLFEATDVIGYLTPEDVTHYMNEIASLTTEALKEDNQ